MPDNFDLDPELADLLEDDVLYDKDNNKISETEEVDEESEEKELNKHEKKCQELLKDRSDYMKKVLKNENPEISAIVLESMKFWENPKVKEDKSKYRERLTQNFWALYREMATKVKKRSIPEEKLKMIRYGLLEPELLKPEQLKMIQEMDKDNEDTESDTIYLSDEWFRGIAKGDIPPSVLDETAVKKKGPSKEKLEGKKGQIDAEKQSAKSKIDSILQYEEELKGYVNEITNHNKHPEFDDNDLIESYLSSQRESISNMLEAGRKLLAIDRQLSSNYKILEKLMLELERIENAMEGIEDDTEADELVMNEFMSFRQMVKMCGGKQGNHFPILFKSYFSADPLNLATKKNVQKVIADVEKLDPSLFYRTYKGEEHRIEPYIVLVPSYGSKGICWEPFARQNKATSRGRIVIPMYPKNLKVAILSALADIRWQIAKEKAQHYWMEEGLTGYYYEYYTKEKLKGNIKAHFINDYILWIAWESKGVQKLHKDVRPVFWRYTPFPVKIKEMLKNRGYYYRELYKKDENRMRSDGF